MDHVFVIDIYFFIILFFVRTVSKIFFLSLIKGTFFILNKTKQVNSNVVYITIKFRHRLETYIILNIIKASYLSFEHSINNVRYRKHTNVHPSVVVEQNQTNYTNHISYKTIKNVSSKDTICIILIRVYILSRFILKKIGFHILPSPFLFIC